MKFDTTKVESNTIVVLISIVIPQGEKKLPLINSRYRVHLSLSKSLIFTKRKNVSKQRRSVTFIIGYIFKYITTDFIITYFTISNTVDRIYCGPKNCIYFIIIIYYIYLIVINC